MPLTTKIITTVIIRPKMIVPVSESSGFPIKLPFVLLDATNLKVGYAAIVMP